MITFNIILSTQILIQKVKVHDVELQASLHESGDCSTLNALKKALFKAELMQRNSFVSTDMKRTSNSPSIYVSSIVIFVASTVLSIIIPWPVALKVSSKLFIVYFAPH